MATTGGRADTKSAILRVPTVSDRNVGAVGLAAVGVILLGAIATGLAYTGWAGERYSPLNHFISELGEVSRSQLALLFDAAIIVGGLGLLLFLVLVSSRLTGRHRTAFGIAGLLAGGFGALVGVLPMDTLVLHRIVSACFFLTSWLVGAEFSIWLAGTRRATFPRWLLVPALFSVAVDVVFVLVYSTYHPVDPDAHIVTRPDVWQFPLLEWASLLSLMLWLTCLAFVLVARGRVADPASEA